MNSVNNPYTPDLFPFIPQDHKNLIYSFLDIKDLVNLSETCKTFHQDEKRKEIIQIKLVHSCFHSSYPLLKEHHLHIFPNIMNYYFEYLKTIKFTEPSINHEIPFFIQPFLTLPTSDKYLIIENLVRYLTDIWIYARKHKISGLFLFSIFENILKEIFIHDEDTIRINILNELSTFSKKTKMNQKISYHFKDSQQYIIEQFICDLGLCYWKDLPILIDIADLLERYDEMYLYEFLYETFQPFIDCQNTSEDEYIELFEDEWMNHMSCGKTYKDRLFELFTSCHYMVHEEFERAIDFRIKRFHGMNIEEEDYDY